MRPSNSWYYSFFRPNYFETLETTSLKFIVTYVEQTKNGYPAGNYMFKVNNRNTRTRCEICSKLTIKTPERRQWRHSDIFVVNFEHISHFVVVFLLLTLTRWMSAGYALVKWLSSGIYFNPFMYNVEKWLNIHWKSCVVNITRCLKYVRRFSDIMPERVKKWICKSNWKNEISS